MPARSWGNKEESELYINDTVLSQTQLGIWTHRRNRQHLPNGKHGGMLSSHGVAGCQQLIIMVTLEISLYCLGSSSASSDSKKFALYMGATMLSQTQVWNWAMTMKHCQSICTAHATQTCMPAAMWRKPASLFLVLAKHAGLKMTCTNPSQPRSADLHANQHPLHAL